LTLTDGGAGGKSERLKRKEGGKGAAYAGESLHDGK